jgi:hypothetical protein
MKQADLGLNLSTKRTRKREFLDEMNRVVPWAALVELVAIHAPEGKKGRPPFPIETMLRIHFMQQWFTLSDPAMEEALHDVPLFREFAGLDNWATRLPDESTILRFRHLLEKYKMAPQILGVLVVVSDSGYSCGGDHCAVAHLLKSARPNLILNVIDLSDNNRDRAVLGCVVGAGGGRVLRPGSH